MMPDAVTTREGMRTSRWRVFPPKCLLRARAEINWKGFTRVSVGECAIVSTDLLCIFPVTEEYTGGKIRRDVMGQGRTE